MNTGETADADETLAAVSAWQEIHKIAQASEDDSDFVSNIVRAVGDPENPLHVLFGWREGVTAKYKRRRARDFLRILAAAKLEHEAETLEA